MIGNIKLSLKSSLILTVVIGLLLGTVFVFGMSYFNATVTRDECVYKIASYDTFSKDNNEQKNNEITLYFTDYEEVTIISASVSDELIDTLENTPENSKVIMLVHPNTDVVLDLVVNGNKLFDFETTMKQLEIERTFFVIFGCFFYLASVAAGIKLVTMRKNK